MAAGGAEQRAGHIPAFVVACCLCASSYVHLVCAAPTQNLDTGMSGDWSRQLCQTAPSALCLRPALQSFGAIARSRCSRQISNLALSALAAFAGAVCSCSSISWVVLPMQSDGHFGRQRAALGPGHARSMQLQMWTMWLGVDYWTHWHVHMAALHARQDLLIYSLPYIRCNSEKCCQAPLLPTTGRIHVENAQIAGESSASMHATCPRTSHSLSEIVLVSPTMSLMPCTRVATKHAITLQRP